MVSLNKSIQQAVAAASGSPSSSDAIDSALKRVELAHQMNVALQKHRTTFITLLHKPKNLNDRFVTFYWLKYNKTDIDLSTILTVNYLY